jgi:hypothetical protein
MKVKSILSVALLLGILNWQCKKTDDGLGTQKNLKESLNASTQSLNAAISDITNTRGYQLISLSGTNKAASLKSGDFQDSITLAKIAGIYEFHAQHPAGWCFWCYQKLFEKTGDTSVLIVKLPSDKIFHPWRFAECHTTDTSLVNNFVITANDYHYYYSRDFLFDYKLTANVDVSDTALGSMDIFANRNDSAYNRSATFTFPNGYSVKTSYVSGDSAKSSISLENGSTVLFKENVTRVKNSGHKYRDKYYSLTIGNVEIQKVSASDSITIYLDGVLQTNAKVEFIETASNTGEEGGMCRHNDRDIKITFDDGTSVLVSDLIQPSLTVLQGLAQSLGSVYFASYFVNYIAVSIYYNH